MALTPLAGKAARLQTVISAVTVNHEFEDWGLSLKTELIEVNGFEKTADADGNYWNAYLQGLNSGQADFGGKYNSSKTFTTSFKPGVSLTYTSLYCGLTTAIGFTLTGKCESINVTTAVKGAGQVKGVFQVEGVTTYPT
jgi:hypothetical protein